MSDPNVGLETLKQTGLKLFVPRANECFIDIDLPLTRQEFEARRLFLEDIFAQHGNRSIWVVDCVRSQSKSKLGWHFRLQFNRPISTIEGIAIAAVLGSDWRREALGLMRYFSESKPVSVLAELPSAVIAAFGDEYAG